MRRLLLSNFMKLLSLTSRMILTLWLLNLLPLRNYPSVPLKSNNSSLKYFIRRSTDFWEPLVLWKILLAL